MTHQPESASTKSGADAHAADLPGGFPDGFRWGAATSAYQIEGAVREDGRGESIWDRFTEQPGAIIDGSSGAVACDHYHRWRDDVALMTSLGLDAYRFSIAWPRILPDGRGAVNASGLDFYDRLVDGLLEAGIEPFPTLYHWDLPQVLEDAGGWPVRATAEAFADFAEIVVGRLGDRVGSWTTINEPFVVANHGYLTGEHAPGRSSLRDSLAASHHILLAHGLALERIRAVAPHADAGITINFTPARLASEAPAAFERFQVIDDLENWWYVGPVAGRGYPAWTVRHLGWAQDEVLEGDMAAIAAPIDFLGVNFYTSQPIGAIERERPAPEHPRTTMGWDITPDALGWLMRTLHERYAMPKYYITENGAAMPDSEREPAIGATGAIADRDRIEYLRAHLAEVQGAIAAGVPIEGYFAWSLLDNFEWAHGYGPKFGLVEIDPITLERRPKQSAQWYSDVVRTGSLRPERVPA